MTATASTGDLRESLVHFETCLETPIVPGELAQWLEDAGKACARVGKALHETVQGEHAQLLAKMGREDSELLGRVEQLRESEGQMLADLNRVELKLGQLTDRAKAVESDEGKLEQPMADFIAVSLAFVVAARTQDTAISTWYMEAFQRDRGVAG